MNPTPPLPPTLPPTSTQPLNEPSESECYKELYRVYETERLILERTKEMDYFALSKIMLNRNVNYYYQRPIIYLETMDQSLAFVRSQTTNTVSFSIKLKDNNSKYPTVMGQIGFFYTDQSLKEIAIFYYIGEEYQRKGYAAEAACPLIRHLFESLPRTTFLKIDFQESNQGSRRIAEKICDDIIKYHPNWQKGKLYPFSDTYTMIGEPKFGKVIYHYVAYDRTYDVTYPDGFFDNKKYFEVTSNGFFIMKEDKNSV